MIGCRRYPVRLGHLFSIHLLLLYVFSPVQGGSEQSLSQPGRHQSITGERLKNPLGFSEEMLFKFQRSTGRCRYRPKTEERVLSDSSRQSNQLISWSVGGSSSGECDSSKSKPKGVWPLSGRHTDTTIRFRNNSPIREVIQHPSPNNSNGQVTHTHTQKSWPWCRWKSVPVDLFWFHGCRFVVVLCVVVPVMWCRVEQHVPVWTKNKKRLSTYCLVPRLFLCS